MNFRNKQEDVVDINLTPLIDVVFLLLIFFMVSTTFQKSSEIQIELPEASGEVEPKKEFVVEISIDSLGRYYVNDRVLVDKKLATLKQAIRQTIGSKKNPHIVINADKNATHQSVVIAMDAANQLGLSKFSLATKQSREDN
ncbi:MAG: biopolymer transporter ExbD [Thioalkalispiraceae bacterium]|jgi:biopolymer transport protein ExbD